jgi:hypothetical protein
MKTNFFLKTISVVVMFILITGTFLSLAPSSISASASNSSLAQWPPTPSITVHLLENVVEAAFWPLNTPLSLTITGSGVSYTAQGTATPDPWGTAGFRFNLGAAFLLTPGQVITISGGTTTKVLTVMDLYVDSHDPGEKTVAGHSDPNAKIRVDIWAPGNPYQEVTADGNGSWAVTFAAFSDPFTPFTDGTASSADNDGDITQFRINMGSMTARTDWPGADNVFYVNCSPARLYTLRIDDPSNGPGDDFEVTQPCTLAGWGDYVINFILVGFTLDVEDEVTVASGHHIRTLVVSSRGSTSFDLKNDTISGVNQPDTYLSISTPGAQRTIKTGSDGKWSIDYKVPGPNGEPVEHIVRGMSGSVAEMDAQGDNTVYGWQVPSPFLEVRPQTNLVYAVGWGKGVHLALSVDSAQGQHLAGLTTIVGDAPSPDPNVALADFSLAGFDLQPGQVLTVSGGGITFAYLIPEPKITKFEIITDTIRGTGTPGAQVVVNVKATTGQRISRWVIVNEAGNWMASFGPPSNPPDSPPTFDLQPGSGGAVLEINKYLDKSWGNEWTIPYPSSGSVAGGGEFNSPAGAYFAKPAFTDTAIFVFAATYWKTAGAPKGRVLFEFKAFDFQSTSLDWMAIEGDRIQMTGTGKVDGKGVYGFMINAVDGALSSPRGKDLLRIRIWDKATGKVIYDNMPGAADAIRPTTPEKNGDILILKNIEV